MNKHRSEGIKRYLERPDVKQRISQDMLRARGEVMVTISRAADLFGFSENQLRDWEGRGLLSPVRSGKHRQYAFADLDKLAIIRELLNANYAPGDIPVDVDKLLESGNRHTLFPPSSNQQTPKGGTRGDETELPIDVRIEATRDQVFWRFFTSQTLRVSLMLIRENLPGSIIGLVLPLHARFANISIGSLEDLPTLGTSIIGWLSRGGSSYHTLFTERPTFRYPTDYCLLPLTAMRNEKLLESPKDNTLIILERLDKRSRMLSLDTSSINLIQRLLAPLYEEEQIMRTCFGWNMHDEHELSKDLSDDSKNQDSIMEGIADIIIRLGGHTTNGQSRWRFCHIMLPAMTPNSLPLQQRSLVTRAQSKDSPFVIGESFFSPQKSKTSLSIRAFQSGRMIYRPNLPLTDRTPISLDVEGPIRSNVAVPIGTEFGQPVAVLYVASDELEAFSHEDQQLLRIMGRLIENLLSTFNNRLQVTNDLRSLMRIPEVVDALFSEFHSENDFMRDIEALLTNLSRWAGKKQGNDVDEIAGDLLEPEEVISFIAIDIDNPEVLASQYGDQIMRYLNKTLGLRIQEMIAPLTTKSSSYRLYYMYASRFYLFLRGISLKKACEKAEQFRASLKGNISLKQSEVADSVLILPDISVHLAITSYSREKCEEFLQEYASKSEISAMISQTLDTVLKLGVEEGGDVAVAWDPTAAGKFGGYKSFRSAE